MTITIQLDDTRISEDVSLTGAHTTSTHVGGWRVPPSPFREALIAAFRHEPDWALEASLWNDVSTQLADEGFAAASEAWDESGDR
jgi:hypothetical protein